MTNGFYKKKATSDSRFATVFEDPDYELPEDKEFDGPGFIDVTGWTAEEVRRLGHADE